MLHCVVFLFRYSSATGVSDFSLLLSFTRVFAIRICVCACVNVFACVFACTWGVRARLMVHLRFCACMCLFECEVVSAHLFFLPRFYFVEARAEMEGVGVGGRVAVCPVLTKSLPILHLRCFTFYS